ncbi:hypothetical protein AB1E18_012187 [Capra hircus]
MSRSPPRGAARWTPGWTPGLAGTRAISAQTARGPRANSERPSPLRRRRYKTPPLPPPPTPSLPGDSASGDPAVHLPDGRRLSRASAALPACTAPSPRPPRRPAPSPDPAHHSPPPGPSPADRAPRARARGAAASLRGGRAVHGARGGPGSGCEDAGVGLPPRPDPTPPCRPHPPAPSSPGARVRARARARKSVVGGELRAVSRVRERCARSSSQPAARFSPGAPTRQFLRW